MKNSLLVYLYAGLSRPAGSMGENIFHSPCGNNVSYWLGAAINRFVFLALYKALCVLLSRFLCLFQVITVTVNHTEFCIKVSDSSVAQFFYYMLYYYHN